MADGDKHIRVVQDISELMESENVESNELYSTIEAFRLRCCRCNNSDLHKHLVVDLNLDNKTLVLAARASEIPEGSTRVCPLAHRIHEHTGIEILAWIKGYALGTTAGVRKRTTTYTAEINTDTDSTWHTNASTGDKWKATG